MRSGYVVLSAVAVVCMLLLKGCAASQPSGSAALEKLSDGLIVPGERIGPVRLSAKIDTITKLLGAGRSRGRGLWPGSGLRTWDRIGLWAVFDRVTGNLLWLSIDKSGRNPFADHATAEGIRLGTTEKELLAIMGPPEHTAADSRVRSLDYDSRGIRFTLYSSGPLSGRVGALRIVWASVARGDAVIVPGERISSIYIGASTESVTTALGGGYLKSERAGDSPVYYWPHLGLSVVDQSGRVISVRAGGLVPTDEPSLKYATAEALTRNSFGSQVVSVFNQPPETYASSFGGDWWVYRHRGIAFELDKDQRVRLIDVFLPAMERATTIDVPTLRLERGADR